MNHEYEQLAEVIDSKDKVGLLLEELDSLNMSSEYKKLHLNRLLVEYLSHIPTHDSEVDIILMLIEAGADAKMRSGKGHSLLYIILYQFQVVSHTTYLSQHIESYKKLLDILVKSNPDLDYQDEKNEKSVMVLAKKIPLIYEVLIEILDKYSIAHAQYHTKSKSVSKNKSKPQNLKKLVDKHEFIVVKKKITLLDKIYSTIQGIKKNFLF